MLAVIGRNALSVHCTKSGQSSATGAFDPTRLLAVMSLLQVNFDIEQDTMR
jgi:hypothetical protein